MLTRAPAGGPRKRNRCGVARRRPPDIQPYTDFRRQTRFCVQPAGGMNAPDPLQLGLRINRPLKGRAVVCAMPYAAAKDPVDMVHLARYTGGDTELNAEILRLFANQAGELVERLSALVTAPDAKAWREVNHTIKGAARGIGAFALADVAAKAEPLDPAISSAEAAAALREMAGQTEAVCRFIQDYLSY